MNEPGNVINAKETLPASGLVVDRGSIAADAANAMRECIWRALEARGVNRNEPATWPEQWAWGFQSLSRRNTFDAVGSTRVRALLDTLLDGDWQEAGRWGQPLVTFPSTDAWKLTAGAWHFDFPARRSRREPVGLRLLTMLSPVARHGGGTLVVLGSHRLVESLVANDLAGDGRSQRVRELLKSRHAWIRDLWSKSDDRTRTRRLMEEGIEIDGVWLRVVELTGEPGDVYFMHPWTLHAPSINAARVPRFMLSTTILTDPHIFGTNTAPSD
jgi:hypothetical protein